jgi:hypothetical protein
MADDTNPSPQPQGVKPWSLILSSRKGVFTLVGIGLVLLMATGFVVLILVQTARGVMTIEQAMTLTFGTLLTAVLGAMWAVTKFVDSTSKEDVAKFAAQAKPSTVQTNITKVEDKKPD